MVEFGQSDISLILEPQLDLQKQEDSMPHHLHLAHHRVKSIVEEEARIRTAHTMPAGKDSVLENVVSALNKRFLGSSAKGLRKDIINAPKRKQFSHRQPSSSLNDPKPYNITELFSAYLGKLKTAHNIYRKHMITEYKEKKQEEVVKVNAKPTDMTYDEVEKIITAEKMNRLMGTKMHHIGAEAKERWEVLKLFPFYRILSMLRYQTSMT